MRPSGRPAAVAVGLLADRLLGEPPARVHPIAAFGSAMERVETAVWDDRRLLGALYAAAGVGGAWAFGWLAEVFLGETVALGAAVALSSAARSLTEAATAVSGCLDAGDVDRARRLLPALVGRDPDGLDEGEIARAVVESLAENLSDAVVATALWGLLAGAPGALAHRAANTLDAMVGHRGPRYGRFGWASARLDDLLGWPAARLTALLVALSTPRRLTPIFRACSVQAPGHPSPNAGVAEAAFAAALDVRLGGTNRYGDRIETRPGLGSGELPKPADIARAVTLVRRTVALAEALLVGVALAAAIRRTEREGRVILETRR